MAIGKSGKHYNNPRFMQSMGDGPDEQPQAEEQDQQQEAGSDEQPPDVMRHEVRKHDDGSYSSSDGEHQDFHDAVHQMAEKFGEKCPVCGDDDQDNDQGQAKGAPRPAASDDDGAAASIYEG